MNSNRRNFLKFSAYGAAVTPLAGNGLLKALQNSSPKTADSTASDSSQQQVVESTAAVTSEVTKSSERILPPSLVPGSKVAILAPASGVDKSDLKSGVKALTKLGCIIEYGDSIYRRNGYLADTDEARAAEFMEFIQRDDIDAIICARGGYGVMRILPLLDFDVIRAHPKIIVGYSDITALVNAIWEHAGVVAFHGPVASSTFDSFTTEYFKHVLYGESSTSVRDSEEFNGVVFSERRLVTLHEGTASGKLIGGNLTLLVSTLGTPFEIDTTDAVLFLEEISEEPYRIDRMLTQLWLAGKLQTCKAIAIGRFKNCEHSSNPSYKYSPSLEEVLTTRIRSLGVPAVYGLPIGHIRSKITVPVGVQATLNADDGILTIDEPSVAKSS